MPLSWSTYPLPNRTKTHFEKDFRDALNANLANCQTLDSRVDAFEDAIIAASRSYDYVWANDAARTAQAGMATNEVGFQQDTLDVYYYSGVAWVFWYNVLDANGILKYLLPSENEFESAAFARRVTSTGSGAINMGKHHSTVATYPNVNQGIYALNSVGYENEFQMGNKNSPAGYSSTYHPIYEINGYLFELDYINTTGTNESVRFKFPAASNDSSIPDRVDIAFWEVWHEEMVGTGLKNALFADGRSQYLLSTYKGITLSSSAFTNQSTYSGFYYGDTVTSYCLDWDTASTADKLTFLLNSRNTYYNSTGNICQCLIRGRSIKGAANSWTHTDPNASGSSAIQYNSSNIIQVRGNQTTYDADFVSTATNKNVFFGKGLTAVKTSFPTSNLATGYALYNSASTCTVAYQGRAFYYFSDLITRLNQGAYHKRYNPLGTAMCADSAGNPVYWYHADVTIASTADCFTDANGKRKSGTGSIASASSGHPLGEYYDQVIERGFRDLRNYTFDKELQRMLDVGEQDLLGNVFRGWEGIWKTVENASGTLDSSGFTTVALGTTLTSLVFTGESLFAGNDYGSNAYIDPSNIILMAGNSKYYLGVYALDGGGNTTIWLHPCYGDVTADFTLTNIYKVIVVQRQTTSFAAHTHTDLIGDPASTDYPTSGMYVTPNLVDVSTNTKTGTTDSNLPTHRTTGATYTGCKDFVLSKKCLAYTDIKTVLVSTDPVASGYTAYAYQANPASTANKWSFDPNTNKISVNFTNSAVGLGYADEADMTAQVHILVTYKSYANKFAIAANTAYLRMGDASVANFRVSGQGAEMVYNLLSKIAIMASAPVSQRNYKLQGGTLDFSTGKLASGTGYHLSHDAFTLGGTTDAATVKWFLQIIKTNNRAYLQVIFKEMRYTTGAWQDDELFQIIDYVKTIADSDSNPCVYGQNVTVLPLPYLIPDKV